MLMGRVLLKMSSLNLDTKSIPREETKEEDWQSQIDKKSYQQSFYTQSARYFKQALPIALHLNKLSELRDCLYLLAMIYSNIGGSSGNNASNPRRDICAQLFLIADRESKKSLALNVSVEIQSYEIRSLIKTQRE